MASMYRRILVAIEHSDADRTILDHVEPLARLTGGELVLVHVADGFAARHFNDLQLRESEEMKDDREYLERISAGLTARGLRVTSILAAGDPVTELKRVAGEEEVDLIAMATHGHRYLSDLLHGTTVDRLRHIVSVPVLLLKASKEHLSPATTSA
jgi:nucleotide-binding universal stress UspA family protein